MKDQAAIQTYIRKYPWPRRRFIRGLLTASVEVAANLLTNWEVSGRENLPEKGPLLIVGNHFHFLDTIAPIYSTRWPLEFIGDFQMPNAPIMMKVFPSAWQTLKVEQGTPNFETLNASEAVLAQNGILVIYPEGHVHSGPLNPALPGAAFLALRTGAPILPMGTISDNNWKLFKTLSEKKRPLRIRTKIGKAFGPLTSENPGRPSHEEIQDAGRQIMTRIAELLPQPYRGEFDLGTF